MPSSATFQWELCTWEVNRNVKNYISSQNQSGFNQPKNEAKMQKWKDKAQVNKQIIH